MRKTRLSFEAIERGLRDEDCDVRSAAMNALKARGIEVRADRTFEPPEIVYKKCLFGVIVSAAIPEDAHVRGKAGQKCRASKAVILGVDGTTFGENVGISKHDGVTEYWADDVVEIEDFDLSDRECSTGYHFFCTRKEAEDY